MIKATVLLSGGIDSTVLLADLLAKGHDCTALTFDYGQHHHREIKAAEQVAAHYHTPWHHYNLPDVWTPSCSSLLDGEDIPETHATAIDSTYVPARNLLLIAAATAFAECNGSHAVFSGANAEDAAGYPDCRIQFFDAITAATYMGTAGGVFVYAPLVHMTKRAIVNLGRDLDAPLHLTWSCYRGGEHHCGRCGACQARQEAMA